MTVEEFGEALIRSGDLDPVYLMLNAAELDWDTKARWSLAYWLFYHVGVASLIANAPSEEFWELVWRAQHEKWPRGTERRHFKGEQSRSALAELHQRFPRPQHAVLFAAGVPHDPSTYIHGVGLTSQDFWQVSERVQSWRGFGPWITFKVADMLDAVLGVPVDFSNALEGFFDDPVKGAFVVNLQRNGAPEDVWRSALDKQLFAGILQRERQEALRRSMDYLSVALEERGLAPKVQELETVFCKYKSHLNGHYPMGKDAREYLEKLADPQWGPLAFRLREALDGAVDKTFWEGED